MKRKIPLTQIILVCLLLFSLSWMSATYALAQEPEPRPPLPPLDGGNGNGAGDGHGDGAGEQVPVTRLGRVSGFVYSYSDYAYAGGVKVVIDGGGWQVETVTDSGGFYQFTGLGAGRGLVNLRLPPGAYPVVFDWPVQLGGGTDLRVDLGYYWQDPSVLPALITGQVAEQTLNLEVKNQTSATLRGGFLEITSPVDLQLSPSVTASQGEMADYSPYQMRFALGAIEPAARVSVNIPLEKISSLSVEPDAAVIRVAFTYDQQKTPLLVNISPGQVEPVATALPQTVVATMPLPPPPPLGQPNNATLLTPLSPLPVTGHASKSTRITELILPILFILGLSLSGCYSLKKLF